ncbi:MAG: low-complexity tail membrane protein [Waterburya sp.]
MKTRSELFLWIHLGGIIVFPLMLGMTLIGLGVGNRYSYWLEIPLLIVIAILPILLMQLYRPFNIFSVLFLALQPNSLTANQRKILALFKRKQQKVVNTLATGLMLVNLWLLYYFAPGAAPLANLLPQQRILGLAIACVALFGSNLFLQIPLSAFQVLLTNELEFAQIQQCTPEEIETDFTTAGIRVTRIPWLTRSLKEEK